MLHSTRPGQRMEPVQRSGVSRIDPCGWIARCPRSGSNRHCDPFKGPASADWATGAIGLRGRLGYGDTVRTLVVGAGSDPATRTVTASDRAARRYRCRAPPLDEPTAGACPGGAGRRPDAGPAGPRAGPAGAGAAEMARARHPDDPARRGRGRRPGHPGRARRRGADSPRRTARPRGALPARRRLQDRIGAHAPRTGHPSGHRDRRDGVPARLPARPGAPVPGRPRRHARGLPGAARPRCRAGAHGAGR